MAPRPGSTRWTEHHHYIVPTIELPHYCSAMPTNKVNLRDKLALFDTHWDPKVVATYNDNGVMVAKLQGEFDYHKHDDSDDFFLVIDGEVTMDYEGHDSVTFGPGERSPTEVTTQQGRTAPPEPSWRQSFAAGWSQCEQSGATRRVAAQQICEQRWIGLRPPANSLAGAHEATLDPGKEVLATH